MTQNESDRVKVYKQKTKKTGNGIQVSIPARIVEKLNIVPGDNVVFKTHATGNIIIEKEETISDKLGVDADFLEVLTEGISEYHEALEDLVER